MKKKTLAERIKATLYGLIDKYAHKTRSGTGRESYRSHIRRTPVAGIKLRRQFASNNGGLRHKRHIHFPADR